MTFHRINEDPTYDDDGILVDEDADWTDAVIEKFEDQEYSAELENFDPYGTVNS